MTQNRSNAVMATRVEPHTSLDDFPTPPWAGRALLAMLDAKALIFDGSTCWEPAANRGYLVKALAERFKSVVASDVHDYGVGYRVDDFLMPVAQQDPVDWIITNPPFRLARDFIEASQQRAMDGVAMLVRTSFLEGGDRYRGLYANNRPNFVFQFAERVPMVKGRYDPKASTATSYAWLVWLQKKRAYVTVFDWIPPCRTQLERASDYPAAPADQQTAGEAA